MLINKIFANYLSFKKFYIKAKNLLRFNFDIISNIYKFKYKANILTLIGLKVKYIRIYN